MRLDTTDRQLINRFQRDLPVCDRPYQAMSRQLGIAEEEVIERLQSLQDSQVLSRVGPVF